MEKDIFNNKILFKLGLDKSEFRARYLEDLERYYSAIESKNLAAWLSAATDLKHSQNALQLEISRRLKTLRDKQKQRLKRLRACAPNVLDEKKDAVCVSLFIEMLILAMSELLKQQIAPSGHDQRCGYS